MAVALHILGVRHHGPGSARSVLRALDSLNPQCVLIEGPPDADGVIDWAERAGMQPPVALLIYQADDARRSVFYPFAEFSPEWCAIRWALARQIPVRFADLPQSHRLALAATEEQAAAAALVKPSDEEGANAEGSHDQSGSDEGGSDEGGSDEGGSGESANGENANGEGQAVSLPDLQTRLDPLNSIAQAAGFDDGERWWEHMFEHRGHLDTDVFAAIREAISALRETFDTSTAHAKQDALREAWMRRTIREALKEHESVVVVCGAWHAPVLDEEHLAKLKKEDDSRLKGLPKVKTIATWVPWSYERLALVSGYGAGVHSPGWYEHLWRHDTLLIERWLTRAAHLIRSEDLDCSSAHVIEATRLATALAAMRNRPLADLQDIADATRAVFCFDGDMPMQLIARKLLLGERLGEVPADMPMVPLEADLRGEQKRLRLKPEALEKTVDWDLRNKTDLERSQLLHRLRLLGIDWGTIEGSPWGKGHTGKGTFHELWRLRWDPAYVLRLIELGAWGNTVALAASAYASHVVAETVELDQLTRLLDALIVANLPDAMRGLMNRILSVAAVGADVTKLMDALPPLAGVLRYGNVRQTDQTLVRQAIDAVLPRIIVGLSGAVASLNDEAAAAMEPRLRHVHDAVHLLDSPTYVDDWLTGLGRVADQASVHGLVCGRATRLLFDAGRLQVDEVGQRLSLVLSRGADPARAAAWIEGFLGNSGLLLLHNPMLLEVLDQWIATIPRDVFLEQIPLLRRTFATFPQAERRQIGELLRKGGLGPAAQSDWGEAIDHTRAARVLPTLRFILNGPAIKDAQP